MPSHLSTIGFDVQSEEDFVALAEQIAEQAQPVSAKRGEYLQWAGSSGEELWLQVDSDGDLVGMNPHFRGKSSVRVGLEGRVRRDSDTVLDGAFYGWADPEEDRLGSGAYPFVFDAPDAAAHLDLELPGIAEAQIAAFAHEIKYYESLDAYDASQADRDAKFASQSFVPCGLFTPDGAATEPPEAMAIFAGHVAEADVRKNETTDRPFYWALVDTLGGRYDVVVDRSLLAHAPCAGGVLSGTFWLSGRLTSFPQKSRSWFGRILRGAG